MTRELIKNKGRGGGERRVRASGRAMKPAMSLMRDFAGIEEALHEHIVSTGLVMDRVAPWIGGDEGGCHPALSDRDDGRAFVPVVNVVLQ